MTMDVEQQLRRTLEEVGSRVDVPDHRPLGPASAHAPYRLARWRMVVAASLVVVCLGSAALIVFLDDGANETVVAGPVSVAAEAVLEFDGLVFRAVAMVGGDGRVCLRAELPAAATPTGPPETVCMDPGEAEALTVGSVSLEQPVGTLVYALGGPGVASMQSAVDQVAVGNAVNVANEDVAVFLLAVEVAGATGSVAALDTDSRTISSAPFAGADLCVADGDQTITVPDVIGKPLHDAILEIERSDLKVVGTGTPREDPTSENAVVFTQAPAPGSLVPRGACVGFRTEL